MTRLGIAGESEGDVALLTGLCDRLLVGQVEWVEVEFLDAFRRWCGLGDSAWFDLHHAFKRAREAGLRPYGKFADEPGALDAQMHRSLLLLFAHEEEPPALVVVGRDVDGEPERERGFQQAVSDREWPFVVIGALAAPEIEAWLVVAWTPEDDGERTTLALVRQRLGFDPTQAPERLTSKRITDKRDAKRALAELCARGRGGGERWTTMSIDDRLLTSGRACGLTGFIEQVRKGLVPLVSGIGAAAGLQ